MTDHEPAPVRPGDHVQVWNRFVQGWAGDFEVVEARPDGIRVKQCSERSTTLPGVLPRDDVRATEPKHHRP